jgi:ribosome biogenesis protein BMS1
MAVVSKHPLPSLLSPPLTLCVCVCLQDALLYAPMSNVGSIMFDKDAVYIDVPHVHFSNTDAVEDWGSDEEQAKAEMQRASDKFEGVRLVKSLQKASGGLDDGMQAADFQLFKGGAVFKDANVAGIGGAGEESGSDDGDDSGSGSDDDGEDGDSGDDVEDDDDDDDDGDDSDDGDDDGDDDMDGEDAAVLARLQRRFGGAESEDEEEEDGLGHASKWKRNLAEKAAASFLERYAQHSSSLLWLCAGCAAVCARCWW